MDIKKYAKKKFYEAVEKNRKKIYVEVTPNSEKNFVSMLFGIMLCEGEINSHFDTERWQTRICIRPHKRDIVYRSEELKRRDIRDVLDELFRKKDIAIGVCVKIEKKLGEKKYLVKLLGDTFILKLLSLERLSFDVDPRKKHSWVMIKSPHFEPEAELHEVDDVTLFTEVI